MNLDRLILHLNLSKNYSILFKAYNEIKLVLFVILVNNNLIFLMILKISKASDFSTINWSGGTSTQLYIFPETANYQERNFDFRLSTATVEIEKSDFTSLPGISRKLMILEGAIEINHENRYHKKLGKFDTDSFEGDWHTSSIGKCIDFNLMTRGTTSGELSTLSIVKNTEYKYPLKDKLDWLIIYLQNGTIEISKHGKKQKLNKGSLLVINEPDLSFLSIKACAKSDLIISKISQNNDLL